LIRPNKRGGTDDWKGETGRVAEFQRNQRWRLVAKNSEFWTLPLQKMGGNEEELRGRMWMGRGGNEGGGAEEDWTLDAEK
jgi:hypothetical protein